MEVRAAIRIAVTAFVCIVCLCRTASADVVWMTGQDEPMFGIVDSGNGQQIQFRQTTDGVNFEPKTLNRSAIRVIVVNHDSTRLTALTQGDWKPWLDYAEELHVQKRDPTAQNLAIRLLLIVVANSTDQERRSVALRELVSLARSEDERERFERLRFLETGEGTLEKRERESQVHSAESRKLAADLVRRVRLQENLGRQLIDESPEKVVIDSFEEACSWQELVQISKANRIDAQSLKRLVALELELRLPEKDRVLKKAKTQWHELAGRIGTSTLSLPSIENITEFDPYATKYVDGKWMKR